MMQSKYSGSVSAFFCVLCVEWCVSTYKRESEHFSMRSVVCTLLGQVCVRVFFRLYLIKGMLISEYYGMGHTYLQNCGQLISINECVQMPVVALNK